MAEYGEIIIDPAERWQVSPRMRHYFLNYLCTTLEASFFDFMQRHVISNTDGWLWHKGAIYEAGEEGRKQLKFEEWSTPGRMEVTDWAYFFRMYRNSIPWDKLTGASRGEFLYALQSVFNVRHSAIKRWEVSCADLAEVIRLPGMLAGHERAEEVRQVWEIADSSLGCFDTWKEAQVRAIFEEVAFPADISLWTQHDLLYKIQLTLEGCCFRFAKRDNAPWLRGLEIFCKEQIELQVYQEQWAPEYGDWKQIRQYELPDPDGSLFGVSMRKVRNLRNYVTHRPNLPEEYLLDQVHNAIQVAIILGEQDAAIDIEIIAEQYLTYSPRKVVLERLRSNYLSHVPEATKLQREAHRRSAISMILRLEGLDYEPVMTDVSDTSEHLATLLISSENTNGIQRRESAESSSSEPSDISISTGMTESPADTSPSPSTDPPSDISSPDPVEKLCYPLTWSPSMHQVLKGEIWEPSPRSPTPESAKVGWIGEWEKIGEVWETSHYPESAKIGEVGDREEIEEIWEPSPRSPTPESAEIGWIEEWGETGEIWEPSYISESSKTGEIGKWEKIGEIWEPPIPESSKTGEIGEWTAV